VRRRNVWSGALLLLFALVSLVAVQADIAFLSDGRVVYGKLEATAGGVLTYQSFGSKVLVNANDILRTVANLEDIKDVQLDVILKDNSSITGKIVDIDDEIGLFLDISFATLVIPVGAVKEMYHREQRTKFKGANSNVYAGVALTAPVGESSNVFGTFFGPSAMVQVRLFDVRELFIGLSANITSLEYIPSTLIKYTQTDVSGHVAWKFMFWRNDKSFLSMFTPFVQLGGGASLVYVSDDRGLTSPSRYGLLNSNAQFAAGLEFNPIPAFAVRAAGIFKATFQSDRPFFTTGAELSVGIHY